MKILYGIQGTGNGHISRGRCLAKSLAAKNVHVDYLFSGRNKEQLTEMNEFHNWQHRDGLSFSIKSGAISYCDTARNNKPLQFFSDVKNLALDNYDLVITDFEPITAWAGKRQKKPVLGIGHQYAFQHVIPTAGKTCLTTQIMKHFAPAEFSLGLHWDNFGQAILPPIINTKIRRKHADLQLIVVYMPWEDPHMLIELFQQFPDYHFELFIPGGEDKFIANVHCQPTSLSAFNETLCRAGGVICNSGFELISECLQLGIPILTKPLSGQMEQLSNAAALQELNYAATTRKLTVQVLAEWLDIDKRSAPRLQWPNVANAIVDWILQGNFSDNRSLTQNLWKQIWH